MVVVNGWIVGCNVIGVNVVGIDCRGGFVLCFGNDVGLLTVFHSCVVCQGGDCGGDRCRAVCWRWCVGVPGLVGFVSKLVEGVCAGISGKMIVVSVPCSVVVCVLIGWSGVLSEVETTLLLIVYTARVVAGSAVFVE